MSLLCAMFEVDWWAGENCSVIYVVCIQMSTVHAGVVSME